MWANQHAGTRDATFVIDIIAIITLFRSRHVFVVLAVMTIT